MELTPLLSPTACYGENGQRRNTRTRNFPYSVFRSRSSCILTLSVLYEKYGYGTTVFSPLAKGLLTGKVRPSSQRPPF